MCRSKLPRAQRPSGVKLDQALCCFVYPRTLTFDHSFAVRANGHIATHVCCEKPETVAGAAKAGTISANVGECGLVLTKKLACCTPKIAMCGHVIDATYRDAYKTCTNFENQTTCAHAHTQCWQAQIDKARRLCSSDEASTFARAREQEKYAQVCVSVKRDLFIWQKRPIHMAKEAYFF